jgi:hypothetical protein
MALTSAQKQTLVAAILADPAISQTFIDGNLPGVADYYNALAAPTFTVWKTNVPLSDVGRTFNASELAGLTQLNTSRLQNLAAWLAAGINPSIAAVRQFFDDIFSGAGGNSTRPALLALWKRPATRLEKLFAAGTGTDNNPATLVVEGALGVSELIGL